MTRESVAMPAYIAQDLPDRAALVQALRSLQQFDECAAKVFSLAEQRLSEIKSRIRVFADRMDKLERKVETLCQNAVNNISSGTCPPVLFSPDRISYGLDCSAECSPGGDGLSRALTSGVDMDPEFDASAKDFCRGIRPVFDQYGISLVQFLGGGSDDGDPTGKSTATDGGIPNGGCPKLSPSTTIVAMTTAGQDHNRPTQQSHNNGLSSNEGSQPGHQQAALFKFFRDSYVRKKRRCPALFEPAKHLEQFTIDALYSRYLAQWTKGYNNRPSDLSPVPITTNHNANADNDSTLFLPDISCANATTGSFGGGPGFLLCTLPSSVKSTDSTTKKDVCSWENVGLLADLVVDSDGEECCISSAGAAAAAVGNGDADSKMGNQHLDGSGFEYDTDSDMDDYDVDLLLFDARGKRMSRRRNRTGPEDDGGVASGPGIDDASAGGGPVLCPSFNDLPDTLPELLVSLWAPHPAGAQLAQHQETANACCDVDAPSSRGAGAAFVATADAPQQRQHTMAIFSQQHHHHHHGGQQVQPSQSEMINVGTSFPIHPIITSPAIATCSPSMPTESRPNGTQRSPLADGQTQEQQSSAEARTWPTDTAATGPPSGTTGLLMTVCSSATATAAAASPAMGSSAAIGFGGNGFSTASAATPNHGRPLAPPPPPPPAPPPPPPPPPPHVLASTAAVLNNGPKIENKSDQRGSLMEAIRAAGGAERARLRKVVVSDEKTLKQQRQAPVQSGSGDDLMCSLERALEARRKVLYGGDSASGSGTRKKKERNAAATQAAKSCGLVGSSAHHKKSNLHTSWSSLSESSSSSNDDEDPAQEWSS